MRLFIGVPVPPTPRFTQVVNRLRQQLPDVKPVPPGSWHVTMRFLGEVKDPRPIEDAVHRIASRHAPMPVTVKGLSAFHSPRRARIIWAKVAADGLRELAADVAQETKDVGEMTNQEFVAHTTLARIPAARDLEPFIKEYDDVTFSEGTLDRLVLFQSQTTSKGPVYRRRVDVPFGAQATD